jgi:transaldolase
MKATQQLHDLGQSLWLDNITRELLTSGTLGRYIDEFSVTGLTSNPSIFDKAIGSSNAYDDGIREKAQAGNSGESLFVELALEDLRRAADLFRPVFDATGGVDGWVSMEVSPLLANDTSGSIEAAARIYQQAQRPNLFIKIPGTRAGIPAIEESIFAGVPINVTLLFSREHYIAAAEAYMRGIERRIAAGLDPNIGSVASIFVSRWDVAVKDKVQGEFRNNRLGIAIAMRTYKAYRDLLASKRWQKLATSGARPQRLLWASTGTKDPAASETLYVEALAAPDTVNTIPEKTLLAFAEHGKIKNVLPVDEGSAETVEAVIAEFTREGVNDEALAAELQREGTESFAKSWNDLIACIASKSDALTQNHPGGK